MTSIRNPQQTNDIHAKSAKKKTMKSMRSQAKTMKPMRNPPNNNELHAKSTNKQ